MSQQPYFDPNAKPSPLDSAITDLRRWCKDTTDCSGMPACITLVLDEVERLRAEVKLLLKQSYEDAAWHDD
jgi:hypothetical protein